MENRKSNEELIKSLELAEIETILSVTPGLVLERDADAEALTLLHHAAAAGRADVVTLLVKRGVDVNIRSGAIADGDALGHGPDATDFTPGYTPLMCAARRGKVDCVRLLLSLGANPSALDRFDYTALHASTLGGSVPTTNILLAWGSFPDVDCGFRFYNEELGWWTIATPLHVAAKANHVNLCGCLIGHGAAVDASASFDQRTPLHYAAALGRAAVVRLLLDAGADPNASGFMGRTPLFEAQQKYECEGKAECINLIRARGGISEGQL